MVTDEIVTKSFTQHQTPLVNVLLDGLLCLLLNRGGHGVIPLNMANIHGQATPGGGLGQFTV